MSKLASKIIPLDKLSLFSAEWHHQNKKIVSTNGCFDILHWGHISYLEKAKELGDLLVVGVNSDRSVKIIKGPKRPLHTEDIRASQIAALECVDYVTIFDEETPLNFIAAVTPNIHVKGGDYKNKKMPEQELLNKLGAKFILLPLIKGFSTTDILTRV